MANCVEQTLVEFLFKFPAVKDFFLRYRLEEWPQVLSTTLVYGIQSIEVNYNRFVSLAELSNKLKSVVSVKSIEESIPTLKTKLGSLKKEIFELEDKLESKVNLKPNLAPQELYNCEIDPEILPKAKPKMVDFWYQTDVRPKKTEKREPRPGTTNKPWAHDYSKVVKNQRTNLQYEDLEN